LGKPIVDVIVVKHYSNNSEVTQQAQLWQRIFFYYLHKGPDSAYEAMPFKQGMN